MVFSEQLKLSIQRQEYTKTGWHIGIEGSAQCFLASVSSSIKQGGAASASCRANGSADAIPTASHLSGLPPTQIQRTRGILVKMGIG